jgi:hypothetical protein
MAINTNRIQLPGFISVLSILLTVLFSSFVLAGPYLNSAHGDNPSGVNRSGMETGTGLGYEEGNCAHCHEQHASIEGEEPVPVKPGPDNYTLFYNNFVNQTDGFCFQCHVAPGSQQFGGSVFNYSYSYQAGGWNVDTINNMLQMFSFATSGAPTYYPSSHNLNDILTFVQTQAWGYTANSNPCAACHNPHATQKDNKTGVRGWPLSRPSEHTNTPWDLWGNAPGELMNTYAPPPAYQAPYYFGGVGTNYEPDNSATVDGSNLVDTVTFCLDCHQFQIPIPASSDLGRIIPAINWAVDVHGGGIGMDASHNKGTVNPPYVEGGANYILSCLDCHEPHSSTNTHLLRSEVNGVQVVPPNPVPAGLAITEDNSPLANSNWEKFCNACHTVNPGTTAGTLCDPPANPNHPTGYPNINCFPCHIHGGPAGGPVCAPTPETYF